MICFFGDFTSTLVSEEVHRHVCNSEHQLKEFDGHLEWYFSYGEKFLEKYKESFNEPGEWEKACENQLKEKVILHQSKKEFIDFRDRFIADLYSIIKLDSTVMPSLNSISSFDVLSCLEKVCNELTETYITQIQDCIFPKDWEFMYQSLPNDQKQADKN